MTLTAVPGSDCEFVRWNNNSISSTVQITMDGNKTAIAYFQAKATPTPTYYSLNVVSLGNGTVSGSRSSVAPGTNVTIIAVPNTGYHFNNWTCGDNVYSDATKTFQMPNKNLACMASFEKDPISVPTYDVSVHSDSSQGIVTGTRSGVQSGERVTITATPNEHYVFDRWDCNHGVFYDSTTYLTIEDRNLTCTAIFKEKEYTITVKVDDYWVEYGAVDVNYIGIAIGGSYTSKSLKAKHGDYIRIMALGLSGTEFYKWTCKGNDYSKTFNESENIIDVDRDIVCVAEFVDKTNLFTVNVSADKNGSVYIDDEINLKEKKVAYGASVKISARADDGYSFDKWECNREGGPFTTATKLFQVDKNISCKAFFKKARFILKVSSDDNGSVYIGDDVSLKEMEVAFGSYVKISAKADDGYSFNRWICRGINFIITLDDSSTKISPNRDITCSADFKLSDAGNTNGEENNSNGYIVSVHPSNNSGGNVAFSDSGNQRESFDHETETSIVATPNEGFEFVGWSDGSTDNPRTIEVDDDRSYVAIFEPIGGSTSDDSDGENDGEKKDDEKDDEKKSDDEESDDESIAVPDTGMNTNSGNNNTLIGSIIMPVTLVALVGGYLVSRRKHVKFDK